MKNVEIAFLIAALGAIALFALIYFAMPAMTPQPIPPSVTTQPK